MYSAIEMTTDWIENIESAWKGHRKFAEWLVKNLGAKTVIELGVDRGYSLFCFANVGIEKIYGIDLWEPYAPYGYDNYKPLLESMLTEKGLADRVQLIQGEFGRVATEWNHGTVDVLHIDGTHEYASVKQDFENWVKYVDENHGIILFHDVCIPHFSVKPFFNELKFPKGWFAHSAGLGVVCRDSNTLQKIKDAFDNFTIGSIE